MGALEAPSAPGTAAAAVVTSSTGGGPQVEGRQCGWMKTTAGSCSVPNQLPACKETRLLVEPESNRQNEYLSWMKLVSGGWRPRWQLLRARPDACTTVGVPAQKTLRITDIREVRPLDGWHTIFRPLRYGRFSSTTASSAPAQFEDQREDRMNAANAHPA